MGHAYDIVPGRSVGHFEIGDTLWHILDDLRTNKVEYPKVDIAWDPEEVNKSAVTIHLPSIDLYFPSSQHQTLSLVRVTLNPGLALQYDNKVLNGEKEPLTRSKVGKLLGPTYAGSSTSKLLYPGVVFDFAENQGQGAGIAGNSRTELVKTLSISAREEEQDVLSEKPLIDCTINPGRGVTVYMPDPYEVILGQTSVQDIVLEFGSPPRKYWKEDDRLAKMWGAADSIDLDKGWMFWNYFQYGLDFLMSPDFKVEKVIAHSNIPGTTLFQRYARCPWTLPTTSGDLNYSSPISLFRSNLSTKAHATYVDEVKLSVPSTSTNSKDHPKSPASLSATSISSKESGKKVNGNKASEKVKGDRGRNGNKQESKDTQKATAAGTAKVVDWEQDVMILDRLAEEGYEGVNGVSPSRLLGFDGLIIEEDQASGGICSILVWNDDTVGSRQSPDSQRR